MLSRRREHVFTRDALSPAREHDFARPAPQRLPVLTPRKGSQGPAQGRGLWNRGPISPLPFVVFFDTYHLNSTTTPATATPAGPPDAARTRTSPRRARGGGGLPLPAAAAAAP